jgi:hypothetical protein
MDAKFKSKTHLLEKVLEKFTKKVISKTSLKNMSKSGKSANFRHVFAKYFFVHF